MGVIMTWMHRFYPQGEPRMLAIALAHYAAKAKPGDDRSARVGRIYGRMVVAERLRFHGELDAMRAARLGITKGQVAA